MMVFLNKQSFLALIIIQMLVSIIIMSGCINNSNNNESEDYQPYDTKNGYNIKCDADFKKCERIYGSGTVNDPYIIENLTITEYEFSIYIQNTHAYVIIRNCSFTNRPREANYCILINGHMTSIGQ